MNKKVLIKIKGVQNVAGDRDEIELVTVGSFFRSDDSYFICYDESDATGYGGSHTTLKYDRSAGQVTMIRTGDTNSQLIIEKGRRHQCNYDTGFGSMTIGVSGDMLESSLNDDGGDISFGYSLDINAALASENTIHISITQ